MATLDSLVLEVPDPAATEAFCAALGVGDLVRARASDAPTSGFRGFSLSVLVAQPSVVDHFFAAALEAGATTVKSATKSLWGYGGVVQAPDGTIWKVATPAKKDKGRDAPEVESLVLLLGVEDVKESKRFYVDHGLAVKRSFGGKYVEFDVPGSPIELGLYGRRALAKDAGVPPEGSGSHRIVVVGDVGPFVDPDGFGWEASTARDRTS